MASQLDATQPHPPRGEELTAGATTRRTRPRNEIFLPASTGPTTGSVINRIEDVLHAIQLDLLHQRDLSIPYRSRRTSRGAPPRVDEASAVMSAQAVRFPGSTPHEARKFARLLKLLQLIHDGLISGICLTKRNIYYQDVELFGSQAIVDNLVDDLAFTLGIGRADLNVVAAGKGLVSGPILLHMHDDNENSLSPSSHGLLIPPLRDIRSVDCSGVRWVMVVEKEATFRTLSTSRYWETSAAGPGIIVTGKGYPDLSTRSFLSALHHSKPGLPIYAVVDFDPDGLHIMQCYKCGSLSLNHEKDATVPGIEWLGIKSADLFWGYSQAANLPNARCLRSRGSRPPSQAQVSAVMPLTIRDRKYATKLLESLGDTFESPEDTEIRRELQIMLFLGVKGEIQGVDNAGDLTDWLDNTMPR